MIEPVEQVLAQVREQFEKRDAGVARVVVGPVRVVDGDAAEQLVPQLGEDAGVHKDADRLRCRVPKNDTSGGTGQAGSSGPGSGAGRHIMTVAIGTRVNPRNATPRKLQRTARHLRATLSGTF